MKTLIKGSWYGKIMSVVYSGKWLHIERNPRNKNEKHRQLKIYENTYKHFFLNKKEWYRWLIDQNIQFKIEHKLIWAGASKRYDGDYKIYFIDDYSVTTHVVFSKPNDHLMFELMWKGNMN